MDHEDCVWIVRISAASGTLGLWIWDIRYIPSLLANAPYHDPVAANAALMAVMYLVAGPMFTLASFDLFETDNEPTVNTENLPSACGVKLTLLHFSHDQTWCYTFPSCASSWLSHNLYLAYA